MNKKTQKKLEEFDVAKWLYKLWEDKPRLVSYAAGAICLFIFGKIAIWILWSNVTPLQRYAADMTGARIGIVLAAGVSGFVLGWLFSPKAKLFRKIAAFTVFALMAFYVIYDHGLVGWGAASILGWFSFFAALGYWVKGAIKSLGEVPTTFGSSRFATTSDLKKHKMFDTQGLMLGTFFDGKTTQNIYYNGDGHLLTDGPTRSKKGTAIIIPNLLSYEGSIVVIDPKGENAMITAKHRASMGQNVHVVDPWNITGQKSAKFNPIDWLVKSHLDLPENCLILADAIIVHSGSGDPFWVDKSKQLVTALLGYIASHPYEEGKRHLGNLRDLLSLDGKEMAALFNRMLSSNYGFIRSTAAQFLQLEDKLLSSILASAQAQTNFLDSPHLRENLTSSDFSFGDLKSKAMTIYLVLPADRLEGYGRWLRLLIQQSLTINARNIDIKPAKPVLFILDEMAALGRLTMIEQAYGLMAGFGIQLWGIVQDLSQLERIYGKGWESFIANSGMINYFGSTDRKSADYFSALCGVTTVWNFSSAVSKAFGTSTGSGGAGSNNSVSTSDTRAASQRQLIYADELMRMHKSNQLVFVDSMHPLIAQKLPWFENDDLKSKGVNLHTK